MIPGEVVEPLPEGHLPAAGELLAKLHNCPPTGLDLPVATRRLNAAQRAVVKDFPDRAFADWITRQLDTITRREATHQRTPVPAHGDLFADNIIVQPTGDLSVIDWETVSLDDPLLDVGMAAVGLCQDAAAHLSTTRLGGASF
jgi:homoserine kinase type II